MSSIIELKNISKSFYKHQALENVSFAVPKGSIYGLLGPNGSGKTTLLRILTGILMPDGGDYLFDNQNFSKNHVKQIGYMPEERGLYPKMKANEVLLYLAQLRGLSKNDAKQNMKILAEELEIADWLNHTVESLSKGMQQKIQFLAASIHKPLFLILDEPFSGLDPMNAKLLTDVLLRMNKEGTSILFSTHRMDTVENLCQNLVLIYQSKVVMEGEKKKIKSEFGKRILQVNTKGKPDLGNQIEILSQKQIENDEYEYLINNGNNQNPNAILELFMKSAQILHFAELVPSIENIFFQEIQKKQTKPTE